MHIYIYIYIHTYVYNYGQLPDGAGSGRLAPPRPPHDSLSLARDYHYNNSSSSNNNTSPLHDCVSITVSILNYNVTD